MQIVRDLAGYTLGRSDILRRAMSKKKGDVMERERQNFVYGNPEENIPKLMELFDKYTPSDWYRPQRDAFRKATKVRKARSICAKRRFLMPNGGNR